MKFQKLTIHNIASIEDAVIDFEAQPLADSDVFLITGKTGAGKSTILDAICLALYANTPRLKNIQMEGNTMDGDKEITLKDPAQLMRRNTGEAYTTLTFTGSNGVHYEATWSIARAFRKVNGKIHPKSWHLRDLDKGHSLTKDNEIKAEIDAAVGLNFDQFCRTTLLAQGEFTRFLNSRDDEKSAILEKITGVDIYSKIGAKVYAVTEQKKRVWETAEGLVAGAVSLSPAEVEEREKALSDIDLQCEQLKKSSEADLRKRDWISTEAKLKQGLDGAIGMLQAANKVIEGAEHQTKASLIRDWNATIDARAWLTEIRKTEDDLQRHERTLKTLSAAFATLRNGEKQLADEIGKAEGEIKTIDDYLAAEADKAGVYEKAQTIVRHLALLHAGRQAIDQNQRIIGDERQALTKVLLPALDAAKTTAQTAKGSFEQEEAKVREQEEAILALDLAGLRKQRDTAKDMLNKIATATERLATLKEVQAQHDTTGRNLRAQKAGIEEKRKVSAELDGPIHEAQIRMEVRREDLERQKDTIHTFASALRARLQVGETCPVCRQRITTEIPHEEELATLVGGLKSAYDASEKEYKKLFDKKLKAEAEIKAEQAAYDKAMLAYADDKSVDQARQKATEACKACGVAEIRDTTPAILSVLSVETNNRLREIDTQILEVEMQERIVKRMRNALDAKRASIEALAAKVIESEKNVNDCYGRIHTAEALVLTKQNEVTEAEHEARTLIGTGVWEVDWQQSPKDFAERLDQAAKNYSKNLQHRQMMATQLESAKIHCNNVRSVLAATVSAYPAWADIQAEAAIRVEHLLDEAHQVSHRLTETLTQQKGANERREASRRQLDNFLAENAGMTIERLNALCTYSAEVIAREDLALKKDRDAMIAQRTLVENAQKMLAEHRDKQPVLDEEDSLDHLDRRIDEHKRQQAELGEKRGAIQQELKTDKENKARIALFREDADRKKADYQRWDRLNKLIGDSTGKKFRQVAQSYVLTNLIHSANSYMSTLTNRYTLRVKPGTFVITLEDAYQGYTSRAASTISGGESFLVSLSLALALSDIGQTLSVDTLFIDEGFGTLSGVPLLNAIETLRQLHTKAGRHVGIISHIEELRDRIPVQIQVNQGTNQSNSQILVTKI